MTGKKYCKANIERFCDLVSQGNSEAVASAAIGIDMETFQDWLQNKPRFARMYAKAKADIQILATSRLLKQTGRDPRAAQYFHIHVHADFRRGPSNRGAATEERTVKLDPVEHAERLREIFGVPDPAPVSMARSPRSQGDEGMSISEATAADKAARDYGAKVARDYERREAKNLPAVPGKGCSV